MAKIVLSDTAPKDVNQFSLGNENFEVPYETDDRLILASAEVHPWLAVEREEAEMYRGSYVEPSVPYEEDVLAAPSSKAFDPAALKAAHEGRKEVKPLAVEAGLDQKEEAEEGGVALTLAADETDEEDSAPRRRRSSKREN